MTEENTYHYVYASGKEVFQCQKCRRERNNSWVRKDPDKKKESDRRYRRNNLEKKREGNKRWAKSNPEKVRDANRKWEKANPETRASAQRRWDEQHPEALKAKSRRRRARERNQLGEWPIPEVQVVESLWISQLGKCAYCENSLSDDYHLDHIIPLARGGKHDWKNVCLACPQCNQRKGILTPREYLERINT